MRTGYKECPFCKNEIKKGAIKCQYCKEMLPKEINEEKTTKKNEGKIKEGKTTNNYGPATRTKRLFAAFFDLILNMTIIGLIYNIIISYYKGRTVGFNVLGIKLISNDGNELTGKQKFYRFLLYRPNTYCFLLFIVTLIKYTIHVNLDGIMYFGIGILLLNTIEGFFKTPTFCEKKLGIKRIQYKKPNGRAVFFLIILLVIESKAYEIIQIFYLK